MCGSAWVGRKKPKSEWWNKGVKAVQKKKQVAWNYVLRGCGECERMMRGNVRSNDVYMRENKEANWKKYESMCKYKQKAILETSE